MTEQSVNFPNEVLNYMAGPYPALARIRADRLMLRANHDMHMLKPFFPATCQALLDIGCGMAVLDVVLAQNFPIKRVFLLDGKGEMHKRQIGWQESTEAWADVNMARLMVARNAPQVACYAFTAADITKFTPHADFVMSIKSCGHHYSVKTYLELVKRSLRRGGHLVLDIRKGTDGAELLKNNGFTLVGNVESNAKRDRLVFRHG